MKYWYITFFWVVATLSSNVLIAQHAYPEGLRTGEKAPEFSATDIEGRTVDLKELIKKGPVILVFYRAKVCPYGKQEIYDFQDKMIQLAKAGRTVVAIGPDREMAKQSFARAGITNEVPFIEDKNYIIQDKYKVTYRLDELTKELYEKKGMKVDKADADGSYPLAMPTVYIISPEGRVKYANCNTDSKPEQTMSYVEKILNE
ncbi:MAG: peroxiredoxin family protein [Bacteroidia bacterium]|nr:peroxiredoxin family protein [Bacteroidia bacterium]MDW8301619.1 peroxiredoxin family protein [Bacteroidia bacterium]